MAQGRETRGPPVVLKVIAAIAVVMAAGNLSSAVLSDAVWVIEKGSLALRRIDRSADPVSFWVGVLAPAALAVWMVMDLRRRARRLR